MRPAEPQLAGSAAIEGVVASVATGRPIRGALVSLVNEDLTVVTGDDGRFRLGGLAPGVYVLQVGRVGYQSLPLKLEIREEQQLVIEAPIALEALLSVPEVVQAWEEGRASGDPGSVRGSIIDVGTEAGVLGAFVGSIGEDAITVTGGDGSFLLAGLAPGLHTLNVRRIGYRPVWVQLAVDADQHVELDPIAIEPNPTELEELVITGDIIATESTQMRGFIERARTGFGHFVSEREIERRHPFLVTDLLRGVPGVRVTSIGTNNTVEVIGTGRIQGTCAPLYFIDGMRLANVSLDDFLIPEVVAGIEVYRRPSEIPPQFNATGSSCGVIVVWTK